MQVMKIFVKGMVIGIANIIPGVSGGTLALLLSIYERLITAIHNISLHTLTALLGLVKCNRRAWEVFTAEMRRIDAVFLILVELGAIASIVALANLMTFLLKNFHDPTYGFFLGLVAVSALVPYKLIKKKSVISGLMALLAVGGILLLTQSVSEDARLEKAQVKYEMKKAKSAGMDEKVPDMSGDHSLPNLMFMFGVGVVGISAMILPGISGSFLLLLMGAYFEVLRAVTYLDFIIIIAFSLGNVVGLLAFARILKYLLRHWYDYTMGFLVGLVLGSLWAIWPFKTSSQVGGETIYLSNHLPEAWGADEFATLAMILIGGAIVAVFIWIEARQAKQEQH